jgi:hypothetical protein
VEIHVAVRQEKTERLTEDHARLAMLESFSTDIVAIPVDCTCQCEICNWR